MLPLFVSGATWSVMCGNDRQDPALASDREAEHQSDCAAAGRVAQYRQQIPQQQGHGAEVRRAAEAVSGDGAVGGAVAGVAAGGRGQAAARTAQRPAPIRHAGGGRLPRFLSHAATRGAHLESRARTRWWAGVHPAGVCARGGIPVRLELRNGRAGRTGAAGQGRPPAAGAQSRVPRGGVPARGAGNGVRRTLACLPAVGRCTAARYLR
jgi:hypothetical protein